MLLVILSFDTDFQRILYDAVMIRTGCHGRHPVSSGASSPGALVLRGVNAHITSYPEAQSPDAAQARTISRRLTEQSEN